LDDFHFGFEGKNDKIEDKNYCKGMNFILLPLLQFFTLIPAR